MKPNKFKTTFEHIMITEGLWDQFINLINYDFLDDLPKNFPLFEVQRFCRDNDFFVDEQQRNRYYTYLMSRYNQIGYILSFEIPIKYIKEKVIRENIIQEAVTGFRLNFLLQNIDNSRSKVWKIDINYKTKSDELTAKIYDLIRPYGLQFHHNGRYPYSDEMKEKYLDWLKKYEKEFQNKNTNINTNSNSNKKSDEIQSQQNPPLRKRLDYDYMSFAELIGFFTTFNFNKQNQKQNIYEKNQDRYKITIEINYDDAKNKILRRDITVGVFDNDNTLEETFTIKPTKEIDFNVLKNKIEDFINTKFKDDSFKLNEYF